MRKYKYYKRVKIGKKAIELQSKGHKMVLTDPYNGYITFEIEKLTGHSDWLIKER